MDKQPIINFVSVIKALLILVLVSACLHFGKSFLMPLAISVILAALLLPLCKKFEIIKIPRALAALLCLFLLLIILSAVLMLLGWQVSELVKDADQIKQKIIDSGNSIQEFIFDHLGVTVETQSRVLKNEQPSITAIMQTIAGSFTHILTNFIFVLAYVFFLLYHREHFRNFIYKLGGTAMVEVVYSATRVSQQYLVGLIKMIVCLWIMYGIGFTILGIKSAIFFAILCGVLEIVPFIGNITGTLLTVLVAAANGASPAVLGGIVIIYAIIQFIQGWVLEPFIVGHQVKINPLFTIIALVIGEMVWGIPGVFLAIPVTAVIKVICDHIEPLKPFGFLIGDIQKKKSVIMLLSKANKAEE